MTLGKDHLINKISSSNGFPKKAAGQTLESLLELMKSTLESGEPIMISRFGKFRVKDKMNRRGRNPQNGNALILDARRVVTFKFSEGLKKRMNAPDG
ncbi:MAG: integration host factor subunit alpha [Deltaproteobacteria bacterium]|nr:integration host factor subunit alpha [Deltaproteobacteria bacterium]